MAKMKIDPRTKRIVNAFKTHGIDLDEELTQCSLSYSPEFVEAMFLSCLPPCVMMEDEESADRE